MFSTNSNDSLHARINKGGETLQMGVGCSGEVHPDEHSAKGILLHEQALGQLPLGMDQSTPFLHFSIQ